MGKLSDQQQQSDARLGRCSELSPEETERVLGSMALIDRQLQALIDQADEIGEDREGLDVVQRDLGSFRELIGGRVTNLKRAAIHIAHEGRTIAEQRSLLDRRRQEVNERLRHLEHREAALETYENKLGEGNRSLRETQAQLGAQTDEVQRERAQLVADQLSLQREIDEFKTNTEAIKAQTAALVSDQAALSARESAFEQELASREASLASSQEALSDQEAAIQAERKALNEEARLLQGRVQEVQNQEEAVERLREQEEAVAERKRELDGRHAELEARSAELSGREQTYAEQLGQIEAQQADLEAQRAEALARQKGITQQHDALQGDLDRLAEQQEGIAKAGADFEARSGELEEEAASLQTREANVKERDEKLSQLKTDWDAQATRLKEQESALETERGRVEELERTARERAEAVEREHAESRADIDGLATEQTRVAEFTQSLALQEVAIARERESLEQGLEDLEQGRFSLAKDQKKIEADRAETEQQRIELTQGDTELHKQQEELESEQERVRQLTESIEQKQKDLESATATLEQDTLKSEETKHRLTEEQEHLAGEREELQQIRGGVDQADLELQVARKDLAVREEAVSELEQHRAEVKGAESAVRNQETDLENRTSSLERQYEEFERREKALQKQEASIKERTRQIEEESASIDAWRNDLDRMRRETLGKADRSSEVNSELEELRQQLFAEQASVEVARSGLQKNRQDIEGMKGQLDDEVAQFEEEKRSVAREREELLNAERAMEQRNKGFEALEKNLSDRNLEVGQAQAEILNLRDQLETQESRLKEAEKDLIRPAELAQLKGAEQQVIGLQETLEKARQETADAHARLSDVTRDVEDDKRRVADEQDRMLSETETLRTQLDAQEREREQLAADRQSLKEQFALQQTELNQKIDELEALRIEHESAGRSLEARRADLTELEEAHQRTLSELGQERHRLEGESKGQHRQSAQDRTTIDKEKHQLQRMADDLADERAELHRMRLSVEVREAKIRRPLGDVDPNAGAVPRQGRWIARSVTKIAFSLLVGAGIGAYLYVQEKPSFTVQGELAVKYEGDIEEGIGSHVNLMQNATVLSLAQKEFGQDLGPLFDPGREDRLQIDPQYSPNEIFFVVRRECDEPDEAAKQIDALMKATKIHLDRVANEGIAPTQGGLLDDLSQIDEQIAAKNKTIQEELIPKFSDPHPRSIQNRLNEQLRGQGEDLERLRAGYDRVAAGVRELRLNADAPIGTLTEEDIDSTVANNPGIQKDFEMLQSQLGLARNLIAEALDGTQGKFKPVYAAIDGLQKTLNERAKHESDLSAAGVFEKMSQELAAFRKDSEVFERDWNSARETFIQPEGDLRNSSLLSRRDELEKHLKNFHYEAIKKRTMFQNAVKTIGAATQRGQATLQEVSRNVVSRGVFKLMQAIEGFYASASDIFLENNLKLNNTAYKISGMNRSMTARKVVIIKAAQLAADQEASEKYNETLRQAEAAVDELGRKRDKQVDAYMLTGTEITELNDAIRIEDELAMDLRQAEADLASLKARKAELDEKLASIRNIGGLKLLVLNDPTPARRIGPSSNLRPRVEKAVTAGVTVSGGVLMVLLFGSLLEGWLVGRRGPRAPLPPITSEPDSRPESQAQNSP